jgi:hypothetical protein
VKEHDMYYACVRAVSGNGLCQYAICMQCYDKNKPKRRLSVLQIQRSTRSVTTDYLISRAQEIRGGVAKHFVTLSIGKAEFQVA